MTNSDSSKLMEFAVTISNFMKIAEFSERVENTMRKG